MLSEIFYTLVLTTASAVFLALLRVLYKSKCKVIKCCGCIEIDRDTEAEEKEDELEIQQQNNNRDINNNNNLHRI